MGYGLKVYDNDENVIIDSSTSNKMNRIVYSKRIKETDSDSVTLSQLEGISTYQTSIFIGVYDFVNTLTSMEVARVDNTITWAGSSANSIAGLSSSREYLILVLLY